MSASNSNSLLLKGFTLVLAIIIVSVGYHAYFDSDYNEVWRKSEPFRKTCKALKDTCPMTVPLETAAISLTMLMMITTAAFFIVQHLLKNESLKKVDMVYQWLAGVLFIICGILFIYSAAEIYSFYKVSKNAVQRYDEKMAAGTLCIINGLVHMAAGFFATRS